MHVITHMIYCILLYMFDVYISKHKYIHCCMHITIHTMYTILYIDLTSAIDVFYTQHVLE